MEFSDYLEDAILIVDAWQLPEKEYAEAVNDQARLMCGMNLEPSCDEPLSSTYAALRF